MAISTKKAAKKAAAKKVPAKKKPAKTGPRDVEPADNDKISGLFADMLTREQRGSDRFLDVVTWNIKWFNSGNPDRIARIARIMGEINGDVFILQEIEHGSMEPVVQVLNGIGAGHYRTFYGSLGGDQRVVFVYDQATVRATSNPVNLFEDDPPVIQGSRKKVFPRLPIHMKLTVAATRIKNNERKLDPFDFELTGVHLKSQRPDAKGDDGTLQRQIATEMLTNWVKVDTDDQDVIIAGDWNAAASSEEFAPLRDLEDKKKIFFESFNPDNEASHFFKNGKSSRLDYIVLSAAAKKAAVKDKSEVLLWNQIADAPGSAKNREALRFIIDEVSDHLPVVARFYFVDND